MANSGYGGQGSKRMRVRDEPGIPGRADWAESDDDLNERDVDHRYEEYGHFNNPSVSETSVLNFTIQNPKYPITVEVIHKICSFVGKVLRIIIVRKRGVQALVEFDSPETASKVKVELNGADIYSGCCTLKIEFAKINRLIVRGNDQDNLDLTVDETGRLISKYNTVPNNTLSLLHSSLHLPQNLNYVGPYQSQQQPQQQRFFQNQNAHQLPSHNNSRQQMLTSESHLIAQQLDHFITEQPTPGSHVFNIQGLTSKWNCEKLFNFLCLYGNVLRVSVKFLKSKDGSAMVQMNNCDNLRQYLRNLNSTYIFGKKIVIVGSRQPQIEPVQRPYELADKEPSYMDFTTNRNNRYLTSEQAQKNRPVAPSNVLYYFNTPPLMTEIDIVRFFDDLGGKRPLKIKNFPARKQEHNGERNRRGQNQPRGVTGLAEFRNITDACECLVLANNYPLQHSASNWPFYFKLTFSGTPITDSDALFGEDLDVSLATITIGAVPEKRTLSPSADDENRSHRRHHSNSSSSAHRHHERRAHSGEQRSPSQE
ncbi:unnamed protein product [Didymodactylos carnosus]|uniref:RRM domain-containing protein n=1 Tax=Didymodactylos carnosus TaxID=1234261 RepID=A0A813YA32_9BILA|nr:unnamed protein product [Didymodactylos carnosus]CAF3667403.1 unnamed protein product [Didymodactylos carnosus]